MQTRDQFALMDQMPAFRCVHQGKYQRQSWHQLAVFGKVRHQRRVQFFTAQLGF